MVSSFFSLSRPFSLDEFDVYEKHFTTMNYRNNVTFKQVRLTALVYAVNPLSCILVLL